MSIHFGDPKFDLRTQEQFLREGKLTQKELENNLKSLPDESKKTDEIPVYEEPSGEESGQENGKTPNTPTFSA